LDTGIKETVYHRERIFGYTREPAQKVQMRVIQAQFSASLIDITGPAYLPGPLYHATDYGPAQAFAREQKVAGADGIHYRSVRHPGHDCHVLYRPRLVSRVDHARHLEYHWSGEAITHVLEIRLYGE
ncbi:RES family NAD+ phosphorylase, partial [Aeromonas caviae]